MDTDIQLRKDQKVDYPYLGQLKGADTPYIAVFVSTDRGLMLDTSSAYYGMVIELNEDIFKPVSGTVTLTF